MSHQIISLEHSIIANGIETFELSMRAPRVSDMLKMQKLTGTDAEKEVKIIADLCEVSPIEIETMLISDYTELQRAFSAFFRARKTNKASRSTSK